jgi:hypothetical protein
LRRLSTSGFGNTAGRIAREIPHEYPSFRATADATADGLSMRGASRTCLIRAVQIRRCNKMQITGLADRPVLTVPR